MMMFENLPICPLTGLSLAGGRAKYSPYQGNNEQVLYTFAPIGSAVFDFHSFIMLNKLIAAGNRTPDLALAGICREASELGTGPIMVTIQMINGSQEGAPTTFEEKKSRFMHLLYQTGSKEHKKRDIYLNNDFPLAFAEDTEEFTRILESLIDDSLIRYDKPNDTPNDWPYGIRTEYYGVLLTSAGKRAVTTNSPISTHPTNTMTNEEIIRQQAKSAYRQATGGHYSFNTTKGITESTKSLREALQRFYQKEAKATFLDEVSQLLNQEIIEHKKGCTMKGQACPYEQGIRQILFFMQQEIIQLAQPDPSIPISHQFNFASGSTNNVATGDRSIQATNTGKGAQLNVASGETVDQSINSTQKASLKELLTKLQQVIEQDNVFMEDREDMQHAVEGIQIQLQKSTPKKNIIERAFKSLHELATENAGVLAGHAIFELLKQGVEMVHLLPQ